MLIVCLDLEGVLVPEIWIAVARHTGIKELELTTRDVADYDELMKHRLTILRGHGLVLSDIKDVIAGIEPLEGAHTFLDDLRERCQVIILSDTFEQFAAPLMKKLGRPTIFCNTLEVDSGGAITGYRLRIRDGKRCSVEALSGIGYTVLAAGDSYNDLTMIDAADRGMLFRPPETILTERSDLPVAYEYSALLEYVDRSIDL